jgi:hypothetical protein
MLIPEDGYKHATLPSVQEPLTYVRGFDNGGATHRVQEPLTYVRGFDNGGATHRVQKPLTYVRGFDNGGAGAFKA